jgi:hypothetical protein
VTLSDRSVNSQRDASVRTTVDIDIDMLHAGDIDAVRGV